MHFVVNNNGDTVQTLGKHGRDLSAAIRQLEEVIRCSFPNGRNYQAYDNPLGYEFRQDRDEWSAMLEHLNAIQDTVDRYRLHLYNQVRLGR